jgi:hypothetical protein
MDKMNKILVLVVFLALLFSFVLMVSGQQPDDLAKKKCTLNVKVKDEQGNPKRVYLYKNDYQVGGYGLMFSNKKLKVNPDTIYTIKGKNSKYFGEIEASCTEGEMKDVELIVHPRYCYFDVTVVDEKGNSKRVFIKKNGRRVGGHGTRYKNVMLKAIPGKEYIIKGYTRMYFGMVKASCRRGEVKSVILTIEPKYCTLNVRVEDEQGNSKRVFIKKNGLRYGGHGTRYKNVKLKYLKPGKVYTINGYINDVWGHRIYSGVVKGSCTKGKTKNLTLKVKLTCSSGRNGRMNEYWDVSGASISPGTVTACCKFSDSCVSAKGSCKAQNKAYYKKRWLCYEGKWDKCDENSNGITRGKWKCSGSKGKWYVPRSTQVQHVQSSSQQFNQVSNDKSKKSWFSSYFVSLTR